VSSGQWSVGAADCRKQTRVIQILKHSQTTVPATYPKECLPLPGVQSAQRLLYLSAQTLGHGVPQNCDSY
jgi:hypothetical protein